MAVARQARYSQHPRHGRHAIPRARASADACRLRNAQLLLPRGVHRTRVSETRDQRVCAPVQLSRTASRHPFRIVERSVALRPPVPPG